MKKTLIVDPINLFVKVVEAPDEVVDELEKAREGLTPKKVSISRGGKTFQQTVYVRSGEKPVPKAPESGDLGVSPKHLQKLPTKELQEIAAERGIVSAQDMDREDLLSRLLPERKEPSLDVSKEEIDEDERAVINMVKEYQKEGKKGSEIVAMLRSDLDISREEAKAAYENAVEKMGGKAKEEPAEKPAEKPTPNQARAKNEGHMRDWFEGVDSRSAAQILEMLGMKNAEQKWSEENWGDEELEVNFNRQIKRVSSRMLAELVERLELDKPHDEDEPKKPLETRMAHETLDEWRTRTADKAKKQKTKFARRGVPSWHLHPKPKRMIQVDTVKSLEKGRGRDLSKGLESHVDSVLDAAGIVRHLWNWSNGMNVPDDVDAEHIMGVLDASGEFGPTRYNHKTGQIEFGLHRDYFNEEKQGKTYEQYEKDWRGEVAQYSPQWSHQRKQQWVQQRRGKTVIAHRRKALKSIGGGNMEAIIKTIDQEYEQKLKKDMDAGMRPGSNLPAGSAFDEPGVSTLPGKGGAKKKSAKAGGFSGGKKLGENTPAGSAYKSLRNWRMKKGSIAPSFSLGSKSGKTVESQTGGPDAPFGYGDRDGEKVVDKKGKKGGNRPLKVQAGKKIGENTPAGSAY